jgi:hypothetical protein
MRTRMFKLFLMLGTIFVSTCVYSQGGNPYGGNPALRSILSSGSGDKPGVERPVGGGVVGGVVGGPDRDQYDPRAYLEPEERVACPMNELSDTLSELRTSAIRSLEGVAEAARECGIGTAQAAGPTPASGTGSRIDQALNLLRAAAPVDSPCATTETTIARRRQNLDGIMSLRGATTVATPSEVAALSISPYADDPSWRSFIIPSSPSEVNGSYRDCAEFRGNIQYVNMNCVQSVDDIEIHRATRGEVSPSISSVATLSGSGSLCGARARITPEVASGVATALETVFSIVSGSSNCPAGPRAAISAMNLGVSILSMTPVSPLVQVMAGIGQRLFNDVFHGDQRRAQEAIAAVGSDLTRRQAQCLFMMIHKERIGCDTNETRRGELRQRLQQKNVLIANLNSRRSDYQGRYSVVPMNDWNMCVARGNSLVDPDRAIEALNGWGLTEVEAALSALAQPAGPAGAPTVTVVVAGPGGEAAAAQQPPPTIWPLLD